MQEKKIQFKDAQIKKNLGWIILRLLRIKNRTRQEMLKKLQNVFIGYWLPNKDLVDENLNRLLKEGNIKKSADEYHLTEQGMQILEDREKEIKKSQARRTSKEACAAYSLWGNFGLSALEFIVGFFSGSIGLIADAIHTAVDILSSAITWIGIRLDKEVQAALIGGIILCAVGIFIAFESITKISSPGEIQFQMVALITIVINIIINAFFSFYKFYVGGRTRSISLIADAYHTKTDIWSSVAVLIGLLGAVVGLTILDAIAGAVVSVFICIGGYELISESKEVMRGRDPKLEKFSKFLRSHLQVLPERGAFVSLWFLSIEEMNQQKNLQRIKKALGTRFPIGLKDEDYEKIYKKIEKEHLVIISQGNLKITAEGREKLKKLAEEPVASKFGTRRKFINAKRINAFSEGL